MFTKIKTETEINSMRESGRMLATVLNLLSKSVQPGMSTKDLSEIAKQELRGLGGQPSFLGYFGYPDILCVSVNDEVVHGIPKADHFISAGDIVSMDFGVTYKGMITDSAISVIAGKGSPEVKKLLSETNRALMAGIDVLKDGVRVGDIANAVQEVLDKNKYGIVRDLVGHGVGHSLHEEPNIPNHGVKRTGVALEAGMTIAIEPMATLGSYKVTTDNDNWTVRTADGSLAAHFEHTILITNTGSEVLTTI